MVDDAVGSFNEVLQLGVAIRGVELEGVAVKGHH